MTPTGNRTRAYYFVIRTPIHSAPRSPHPTIISFRSLPVSATRTHSLVRFAGWLLGCLLFRSSIARRRSVPACLLLHFASYRFLLIAMRGFFYFFHRSVQRARFSIIKFIRFLIRYNESQLLVSLHYFYIIIAPSHISYKRTGSILSRFHEGAVSTFTVH